MYGALCVHVRVQIDSLFSLTAFHSSIHCISQRQNDIGLVDTVVCPGGVRQCPSGHSCCSVPGSDQVHCCPDGYSCENGMCQETSIEFPAAVFSSEGAKLVKCNNQYACPDR